MVLNLSPVEIAEDDCHTEFGIIITIQSKDHAITLVGKYYSHYNPIFVANTGITKAISAWKLFTEDDINKYIGQTFVFRSPITCQTENFKICKKCFGNYPGIKSPLVGIIAGQSIAERMTQLSLRTFHSSGSCSLPTNDKLVDFLSKNLKEIINLPEQKISIIICSNIIDNNLEAEFRKIPGYIDFDTFKRNYSDFAVKYEEIKNNIVIYQNQYNVENQDVTQRIKDIKALLVTQKQNALNTNIANTYQEFMNIILELNNTYSSFIETIFTNTFIRNKTPIRYLLKDDPYIDPDTRLNYKQINKIVSKLLGLIYEPNSISISHFGENDPSLQLESNTIFEKMWNGYL